MDNINKYIVVTADIINSRQYNNIVDKVEKKISNIDYADNDLNQQQFVKYNISRGDEIQGVFKNTFFRPEMIRRLRYQLLPYKIRVGVGVGDISEGIEENNSWDMNGSAFFHAREALDKTKSEKAYNTFYKSYNNLIDEIINTFYLLIDSVMDKWTDAQWEAVNIYEKEETYKNTADILGIAFQNVEKRCDAANWREVRLAEKKLIDIINNL
ncbi:MAG: SatD family protein [bacterium]